MFPNRAKKKNQQQIKHTVPLKAFALGVHTYRYRYIYIYFFIYIFIYISSAFTLDKFNGNFIFNSIHIYIHSHVQTP